jgi:peptidoglycan/LPS O-acetylase OafA/YrhL
MLSSRLRIQALVSGALAAALAAIFLADGVRDWALPAIVPAVAIGIVTGLLLFRLFRRRGGGPLRLSRPLAALSYVGLAAVAVFGSRLPNAPSWFFLVAVYIVAETAVVLLLDLRARRHGTLAVSA